MSAQIPPPPNDGFWAHQIDPFLIQFPDSWPVEGIRWYGLAYIAGFAVAYYLLHLYFKKGRSPFTPEQQGDLLTAVVLGTLLGGRIGYYLFYRFDEFLADPKIIFYITQGGMASHGGMIGILLGMFWFARKQKYSFWQVADITVTLGPPGVFFGRIANFINGELFGRPSDVPWAMHFLDVRRIPGTQYSEYYWTVPVHPSQLYQAAMEGLLLAIYLQIRFWMCKPGARPYGQLTGEFLIGYAILRVLGEVFREPDASLILGLSRGTFYSLFMVLAGVAIIIYSRKAKPKAAVA